ncbi:MAG TPA: hypothetical protein VG722_07505 [Tepidisphaeraceae bacterium]|nr:hypothetical protein [Tepidisphaeraceae bacterium]
MLNRLGLAGLVLAGLAAIPAATNADTIAGWDFTVNISGGTDGMAASVTAPGTSASITRNGTVAVSSASYSYDSKGWQSSDTTNNVALNMTVTSGGPWDVTDLLFSAFRSGTGPSVVDIYYIADASTNIPTLLQSISVGTTSGVNATNYDVPINLTISSSLSVYFVADSNGLASGASGTLRLNNVSDDNSSSATYFQLAGHQISSVPTPAEFSAGMVGLLLVGAGAMARRRRIAQ